MNETEWLVSTDSIGMFRALEYGDTGATLTIDGHTSAFRTFQRNPIATDRKLRLFVCACCSANDVDGFRFHTTVDVAERLVDGGSSEAEVTAMVDALDSLFVRLGMYDRNWSIERQSWWLARACLLGAMEGATEAVRIRLPNPTVQSTLMRDIFGNPYRLKHARVARGTPLTMKDDPYRLEVAGFGDTVNAVARGTPVDGWMQVAPAGAPRDTARWRAPPEPAWLTPTVIAIARNIYEERRWDELGVLGDALEESGCSDPEMLSHCRERTHVRGCWVVDAILGKR